MNISRATEVLLVNFRICILEIASNPLRTIITSFGILLGVVSLLANLSLIRAMEEDVRRSLETMGGLNIVTVRTVEAATTQERMSFQRSKGLSVGELQRVCADVPYVRTVLPQAELRGPQISGGGRSTRGHVQAVSYEHAEAYNYQVSQGRWFTPDESSRGLLVCVVGTRVTDRVFGKGVNAVGRKLTIDRQPFTVVGTLGSASIQDRRAMELLIPYAVYTSRYTGRGHIEEELAVMLTSSQFAEAAKRELTQRLLAAHRGVRDFEVEINTDRIKEQESASRGLEAILWCIAGISLLVGGVSIMNIMFATIGDRIREIGIRKALGAQRADIFTQFIVEAVLVCLVGGGPGMVLGACITLFPKGVFPFDPQLTTGDYVLAVFFILVVGVISGLSPALRAANMEPVEALRY